MSIPTQSIAPGFSVAAQLTVERIAEVAALGFKTLINNRPDGEGGPDQPMSAAIAAAVQAQPSAGFTNTEKTCRSMQSPRVPHGAS